MGGKGLGSNLTLGPCARTLGPSEFVLLHVHALWTFELGKKLSRGRPPKNEMPDPLCDLLEANNHLPVRNRTKLSNH